MAIDLFGWSKWSPHLGNAITIATGIPVVSGLAVGAWASLSGTGLSVLMVSLAVAMMTLWCCIGFLWLRDRSHSSDRMRNIDCSWALRVDAAYLCHEVGNPAVEWQLQMNLRNSRNLPLRVDILENNITLENMVPTEKMEYTGIPCIVGPGETFTLNFPSYRPGSLPDKERFIGNVDLRVRYGYPDGPYSRVMTRRFRLQAVVRPPTPPGMTGVLIPIGGMIQAALGAREQDRDEPYDDTRYPTP
jgi:hypothetical protein